MNSLLFTFKGISIYSQGLISGFAYLLALFTLKEIAKKKHLPVGFLTKSSVYIFVISLCSARLAFLLFHPQLLLNSPSIIFKINDGGLFLPGAMSGAIVAIYYMTRNKPIVSFLEAADIFSCIVPMVLMFGKIGCFLNGCCFGTPSTSFFRVIFPLNSPAFHTYKEFMPLHPVQLYASITNGFIFLLSGAILEHCKFHGFVFSTFIFLFSLSNIILLFIRGDLAGSPGIILFYRFFYILLMICGVVIFKVQYRKYLLWKNKQ